MVHYLGQVLWVDSVHDIKEVFPRRAFAFSKIVWEVSHKVLVFLELWPELLH